MQGREQDVSTSQPLKIGAKSLKGQFGGKGKSTALAPSRGEGGAAGAEASEACRGARGGGEVAGDSQNEDASSPRDRPCRPPLSSAPYSQTAC